MAVTFVQSALNISPVLKGCGRRYKTYLNSGPGVYFFTAIDLSPWPLNKTGILC